MALIRMPAIYSQGSWNELYPAVTFNGAMLFESRYARQEFANVGAGEAGLVEVYGQACGQEIAVSGLFHFTDMVNAKSYEEALEALLVGSDGRSLEVDLCEWIDTAGSQVGIWRGCRLAQAIRWQRDRTIRRTRYDFTLRSKFPFRFATGTGGTIPDYANATYKAYQPNSDGISGTAPGAVVIEMKYRTRIPIRFAGVMDAATAAGNAARLQQRVVLSTAQAMLVKALWVEKATPAPTGQGATSTFRVADEAYTVGTPANSVAATVAATATYGSAGTGSFSVAAGSPVYVYIPAGGAGWHEDVELVMEVIPA